MNAMPTIRSYFTESRSRMLLLLVMLQFVVHYEARAGWSSPVGVKVGNDSAVEAANPNVASQLIVQRGSCGFLGSASIHGPVTIREQNGWGSPVVTVAGTFEVAGGNLAVANSAASIHTFSNFQQIGGRFQITDGASFQTDGTFDYSGEQFEVTGGSTLSVGNLTSGGVDTGFVTINGGSNVTVRTLSMNHRPNFYKNGAAKLFRAKAFALIPQNRPRV